MMKTKEDFSDYILFTYVHDDEDRIVDTFEMVFNFEKRPTLWVWLDEGSNDSTIYMIEKCIERYGITMPTVFVNDVKKDKPDWFSRGHLMNMAFQMYDLKKYDFEFAAFLNMGDKVPVNYFRRVSDGYYLDGELSQLHGLYRSGYEWKYALMTFKWWTVKNIENFWDYKPRLHMAHNAYGLRPKMLILGEDYGIIKNDDVFFGRTYDESYSDGKFHRYVGSGFHIILGEIIYRTLKRRNSKAFWSGYWQNRGYDCLIPEMKAWYSPFYRNIWNGISNILRKGVNKIDMVISNYKGRER